MYYYSSHIDILSANIQGITQDIIQAILLQATNSMAKNPSSEAVNGPPFTVLKSIRHCILSWARSIKLRSSHHTSLMSILIWHSSKSRSSKWSPPFRFSNYSFVWISSLSHPHCILLLFHPTWFYQAKRIGRRLNVIKLLIIKIFSNLLSPSFCQVKIFHSVHFSHTTSIHMLSLLWETLIVGQINLQFCIFWCLSFYRRDGKSKDSELNSSKHSLNLI